MRVIWCKCGKYRFRAGDQVIPIPRDLRLPRGAEVHTPERCLTRVTAAEPAAGEVKP